MVNGKLFKGVLSLALVTVSMAGLNGVAEASGTGDNPVYTEDVMTPEQLTADAEFKEMLNDLEKNKQSKPNKSTNQALPEGSYKALAVPSFEQSTSYYCGPATVKQVLHYLKGTSSSQGTYATQLGTTTSGTDFSLVDNVLNSNQSSKTYVYSSIGSYSNWTDTIDVNLTSSKPTVLDLSITPSYMPKYTRNIAGHILNTSGVDSRTSPKKIRLTDPFDQDNRGVTLGNIWHTHSGVYSANNAHFRAAFIR